MFDCYYTFQKWDRSHFLENLSGQETDCAMVLYENWSFPKASKLAKERGLNIKPIYGVTINIGETQPAMEKILKSQKFSDVFAKV